MEYECFVVNMYDLRQAGRICGEVSDLHSRSKRFASGRRCVRLLGVHRCKRFASGRRCVRFFCAYLLQPRRNGRSPGRSAAALRSSTRRGDRCRTAVLDIHNTLTPETPFRRNARGVHPDLPTRILRNPKILNENSIFQRNMRYFPWPGYPGVVTPLLPRERFSS